MGVSNVILDQIKQRLQAKQIRYHEVASRLSVAESTVKRWFSTGNLSLAQLDQICEFLDLQVEDVLKMTTSGRVREEFDEQQEEFFAGNEKALVIFYLLSSGARFSQILANYQFTKPELERALFQLDKHGLIELQAANRVRLLKKIGTWWNPRGPLSRKYYALIKNDFIMSDFSKEREAQWFFSGPLTAASHQTIVKKMNALAFEIASYYQLDEQEPDAKNVTIFAGLRPWSLPLLAKYRKKS